jgi:hypothetical protein
MDIFFIYRILSSINANFGEASFDGIKGILKYLRNLAIIVAWTTILIFMLTYIPTIGTFSCMLFNLFFTLSCGIAFYGLFQSGADIGIGPYILLIATIFMVISSIIMCISYNRYASKYEEKTGTAPELTGLYKEYYDYYTNTMILVVISGVIATLTQTYISTDKSITGFHKFWDLTTSWKLRSIHAANAASTIVYAIGSLTAINNSTKFIHIYRNLVI